MAEDVLTLGGVLASFDVTDLGGVVAIRHAFTEDGLRSADATPEQVLAYTRAQGREARHQLGPVPRRTWLVFMKDAGRHARFYCAYDNRGEVLAERTDEKRFFDLYRSGLMRSLENRLVRRLGESAPMGDVRRDCGDVSGGRHRGSGGCRLPGLRQLRHHPRTAQRGRHRG